MKKNKEWSGQAKQKAKAAKGKGGARPRRASTRTHARDPGVASSHLKGAVSASTRNSPGALAESPVEQRTVRETGRVSDRVHTRQPPQRTQPKTNAGGTRQGQPHRGAPDEVRRGASPAPPPRRGPAAGTKSPVLGRPPRAPRSRPLKLGAQAPGLGKGTTATGKPIGAPRATGRDEARRTTRGHEARRRGTPPATTKAHGQVPRSDGCWVPQTRRARTTRNEPPHKNGCRASANPNTTNPSQEWRGAAKART